MVTILQKNARTLGLAVCAGVLSSVAIVGSGFAADPELVFYPAAGWSVEELGTENDMQMCSISNEYNNGYIVQLTGSERGVNDISIDFRQSVFETNESYSVMINIPNAIDVSAIGIGSNEQVLSVNLNGREGFMSAMGQQEVLDFYIEENAFRFHLGGFKNAMERFETCVYGKSAADIASAPEEIFETVPEFVPDYVPEYVHAPEIVTTAQTEPEEIIIPVIEVPVAPEILLEPVIEPVIEAQTTTKTMDEPMDLSAPPPMAQEDVPFAITGTDAAPMSLTDVSVAQDLTYTELLSNELFGEKDSLEDVPVYHPNPNLAAEKAISETVIFTKTVTEQIDNPDFSGAQITKTSAKIEADFTDIDMPDITPPSTPIPFLEEDLMVSTPRLAPEPVFDTELYEKIVSLEKTINDLRMDNSALEDDLQDAMRAAKEKRVNISSGNWDLERATMKFRESERQIERLSRQISRERAQHEQDTSKLEAMLFDPEVTNTQQLSRLSELERELEKASEKLNNQQRKYETRIQILEKQLNAQ